MYLNGKPLFPFGHGLSYTQFKYSNLRVSPRQIPASGKATVRVDVENTANDRGTRWSISMFTRSNVV